MDWIVSNTSTVHVCNNLEWFTHYTPFPTRLGSIYTGPRNGMEGLGVGDVALECRIRRNRNGNTATHRTLILRDVVYAPSAICNILAQQYFRFESQSSNGAVLYDPQSGARMALLDCTGLFKVMLKGQRFGQSSLDPDCAYLINATWHVDERLRWEEERHRINVAVPPPSYDDSTTTSRSRGNAGDTSSNQSQNPIGSANPPAYTRNRMAIEQRQRHAFNEGLPVSRPVSVA